MSQLWSSQIPSRASIEPLNLKEITMKKLLLITAMFMAMNTWSAEYKVCSGFEPSEFYSCTNNLLMRDFIPVGGLVAYEVKGKIRWAQAMYKK